MEDAPDSPEAEEPTGLKERDAHAGRRQSLVVALELLRGGGGGLQSLDGDATRHQALEDEEKSGSENTSDMESYRSVSISSDSDTSDDSSDGDSDDLHDPAAIDLSSGSGHAKADGHHSEDRDYRDIGSGHQHGSSREGIEVYKVIQGDGDELGSDSAREDLDDYDANIRYPSPTPREHFKGRVQSEGQQ